MEVAVGEFGISADKIIRAIDKAVENQKMIAPRVKPVLEGMYNID